MAKEIKKKQDSPAVFDVSKPGKTEASATSRPIVVTQNEDVEDPMVSPSKVAVIEESKETEKEPEETEKTDQKTKDEKSLLSHRGKTIQPVVVEAEAEPATQTEPVAEAKDEPEPEVKDTEPEAKTEEPALAEEAKTEQSSDASNGNAEINAVAKQAEAKKAQKETEEEIAKRKALQELIDSKKYFIPLDETKKSRSIKAMLIIIIILGLGVAGYAFYMTQGSL